MKIDKMTMRKSLIFCTLIIITINSFGQNVDSKVYFYDSDSIRMEDLKGKPNMRDSLRESFINATFEIKNIDINVWTGKSTFKGYALYYQNDSWVKSGYENVNN